jgi:3-phosphoshikimate 1-carboxyvinyltransferase
VKVKGPVTDSRLTIDGSVSSQFVSSLLMMSPLTGKEMEVRITGDLVSKPYIDITLALMKRFGVSAKEVSEGLYRIEPGDYIPADYTVPADFSSAAFPLVAGALGGSVTARGLDLSDAQGDSKVIDILRDTGADITVDGDKVTCTRRGRPKAAEIDMGDIPDLFPVIAVLLSTAECTSRLYGAPHLRFKESDRIATVTENLSAMGADVTPTDDGMIIRGHKNRLGSSPLYGAKIKTYMDHRIAMSFAIASLVAEGKTEIDHPECVDISYPEFYNTLKETGDSPLSPKAKE